MSEYSILREDCVSILSTQICDAGVYFFDDMMKVLVVSVHFWKKCHAVRVFSFVQAIAEQKIVRFVVVAGAYQRCMAIAL